MLQSIRTRGYLPRRVPSSSRNPAHLTPRPHHPLCAGVGVAGPGAVGSQRLLTETWLWACHQTLLFTTTTGLGTLEEQGGIKYSQGLRGGSLVPTPRPRSHLSPGRRVPAEAGLGPTELSGGWLCRPRLAVEGPQWPEVPCVHTLYIPCGGASATIAGALESKEHTCRHILNPCTQYDPVKFMVQQG